MTNEKMMTNKAFYEAIIAANLSEEITAKAEHLLELVNAKAGKVSKATEAKRTENAEALATLVDALEVGKIYSASMAAALLGVSTQKASYLLREGVKAGKLTEKGEVKLEGASRKCKGYEVATEIVEG